MASTIQRDCGRPGFGGDGAGGHFALFTVAHRASTHVGCACLAQRNPHAVAHSASDAVAHSPCRFAHWRHASDGARRHDDARSDGNAVAAHGLPCPRRMVSLYCARRRFARVSGRQIWDKRLCHHREQLPGRHGPEDRADALSASFSHARPHADAGALWPAVQLGVLQRPAGRYAVWACRAIRHIGLCVGAGQLYAGLYASRRPVHLCAAGDCYADARPFGHAAAYSQPCFTVTYGDCHWHRALAHADADIIRRADDDAHDRPERNAVSGHAKRNSHADAHTTAADAHTTAADPHADGDDRRHTVAHHQAICHYDRYNAAADRYTGPIPHIAIADTVTFDTPGSDSHAHPLVRPH